jgi:hypothetical protein
MTPPRVTPALRLREIVEVDRRLSLSSRSSLFGSAGKEATVAPCGVVANAEHSR